ncbi:DUF4349 domain-containing protein [Kaistella antarctica]|uniref:DUF4349 domain-containing protein n=1 Tax=Kaistella antarctica TaxID=266748 RepID=A0A3S4W1Y8_9FLAO|nr:DUF4349 domain-containing protein [Kaistella antarctica]KEY19641.1 hypothetical protein HY04_14730 [Kaistella antarctica]SEW09360.1 protein of unknown function [Kaistella antarctica]VEH96894.1 Uncharacterised protein [Kaistella antarctica]
MKNILVTLLLLVMATSCSEQEFSEATSSIKRADSLFTKANDGLKTIDSISKRINDSDGVARKVLIPTIEKQTKRIDSTLKSGRWKIDSINKDIAEITKHVKAGTDVAKTLDSANKALQNGENAISVLAKTADKILKRTQSQKATIPQDEGNSNSTNNRNNTVVVPPIVEKNPLVKTAILEIQVEDITQAKSILKQKIRESNADLVSENFSQKEGFEREYVTLKVPLYNFDNLVSNLSNGLGEVKSKSTESEGKDYISSQMCDIEITLVQKELTASNQIVTDDNNRDSDTFGSKSSSAFMSGFKVLGEMMIAILPLWPIFLIAGLIFYFVRRNKKNKEIKLLENKADIPVQKAEITTPSAIVENDKTEISEEPDYSKYLPKK